MFAPQALVLSRAQAFRVPRQVQLVFAHSHPVSVDNACPEAQ